MNKILVVMMMALGMNAWAQDVKQLSFHGKAAIAEVQQGKTTKSIRLKDRTLAPTSYKAGDVVTIINSNADEDKRSVEAQAKEAPYKFIELTKLTVSTFASLPAADQAELSKYYSKEKIAEAKDVVTIIEFKPRATR